MDTGHDLRPDLRRGATRAAAGFTLIEMLITVALIAILAAIALPSYQRYLLKSRRGEAQAYLMAVAARQQQFLLDTRAYAASAQATGLAVPERVSTSYSLAMTVSTVLPPSFTLTATPIAAQASEDCGVLSIDNSGARTPADRGCW